MVVGELRCGSERQPPFAVTKMAGFVTQRPSYFCVAPDRFARAALRTVGLASATSGCFAHELQASVVFGWLPAWFLDWMLVKNNENFRRTGKKRAENAEAAATPPATAALLTN